MYGIGGYAGIGIATLCQQSRAMFASEKHEREKAIRAVCPANFHFIFNWIASLRSNLGAPSQTGDVLHVLPKALQIVTFDDWLVLDEVESRRVCAVLPLHCWPCVTVHAVMPRQPYG